MRLCARPSLPFVFAALAACTGPDQAAEQRLQARFDALAQRLDAVEQRLGAIDRDLPSGERLRSDLAAVEQRLNAVDAKATDALAAVTRAGIERAARTAAAQPGAAAPARPVPQVDPMERRSQLGALMTEYRRRLAELQSQQPDAAASPRERAAARRQVREWYLARRRAILTGQPLPD